MRIVVDLYFRTRSPHYYNIQATITLKRIQHIEATTFADLPPGVLTLPMPRL